MLRSAYITSSLVVLLTAVASPALGQTVDDIVAKNLKAKGGVEALKSTNTVRMTGKLTAPNAPAEMAMVMIAKRPNLVRREMTLNGMTTVFATDGSTVWAKQGSGPTMPITGSQADQVKQGAEFDSVFLNYKEKGHTVELVGNETLKGVPVHHLKVVRKDGLIQDYYLDAQTGLETKMTMDTEQAGVKLKVDTELSDYRDVGGRMVPFKMQQFTNGTTAALITFDKIEFNVPVDDALFQAAK